MRRVNVRELHHRTGALVEEVAHGGVVVVERRGVVVAEIRPATSLALGFPAHHWKFLAKFPKLRGDSGKYISKDRDRG